MSERTGPMRVQTETARALRHGARGFDAVEAWVFDLDNTLYPHHVNLWQQVDVRIRDYIANFLKLTHDEAFRLQKDLYRRYGTSLRGLMEEHGLDPDEFLEMVHDIDYSPLTPDPALGRGDRQIARPQAHSDQRHARACRSGDAPSRNQSRLSKTSSTSPRPSSSPSRARSSMTGFSRAIMSIPAKAAIFEDLSRNLEVPHARGMTTVLVVPDGTREVFREDWELSGRDEPHVDHVTDDLTGFLHAIMAPNSAELNKPSRARSSPIAGQSADMPGDRNEHGDRQGGVAPQQQVRLGCRHAKRLSRRR